ncbi:MAG TPA: 2-C-methyl-D-erythritol 2,4-cyclodiphosphate synthase, partial [Syntrophales bacterium]|nr:2-C-methyl-D-erythritol 2,4-cyclodiphosphate synthase [Syntrophales bacterium]
DSHRLATGRPLILGGVEVPFEKGLLGHSDADALLHAVGEAILGAAGERDIGCHFPDSDPAFKDISSRVFLDRIFGLVRKNGFAVNNVDVTVVLEKPKLSPHIPDMRKTLESLLDLPADRVSIKARTNEGMGFVGRGEGVAVFAVVSLKEL